MISLLAKSQSSLLPTDLLKPIVPTLISGTMEKNSMVMNKNIPYTFYYEMFRFVHVVKQPL